MRILNINPIQKDEHSPHKKGCLKILKYLAIKFLIGIKILAKFHISEAPNIVKT